MLLLLAVLIVTAAWGQASIFAPNSSNSVAPDYFSWEWTTEEWTSDDAVFTPIIQEVKEVSSKGKLDINYLIDLKKAADQNPEDVEAQFRWGYAMLEAPYAGVALQSGPYSDYYFVVRALARPKSPRSYLYARLRFVLMSLEYDYPQLKSLGLRLLERKPSDTPVKTYLVPYLSISDDAQEREQALKYAQELVAQYPKWSGAYSVLGSHYKKVFFRSGDVYTADKAVAAFKKFISLLSTGDEAQRARALDTIQMIEAKKKVKSE